MSFVKELQRRNVIRVATLYIVASWLILQVAELLFGVMGLPDWSTRLVLGILLLGFPLALVFSWVFEVTPEGIVRDTGGASSTAQVATIKKLDIAIAVLLVGAIGFVAWDRLSSDSVSEGLGGSVTGPGQGPDALKANSLTPSIAVLPFVNMSANTENEYFSDGLTDTLLHKLAQVRALKVAARTSSFAFKGTNTDIREIAQTLSVANVLEGSVQRAGNKVRITAQLIQASDGYHLWSGNFDRELDDIFKVQDEIATQVAKALTGSLLQEPSAAGRSDGGTDNTAAYDAYLKGREAYRDNTEKRLAESMRLLREAVTLDPNFALAWSALAESILGHSLLAGLSFPEIEVEVFAAADRGVELAPGNSVTVGVRGYVSCVWRRNTECRTLLERALENDPNNVWALSRLADAQFTDGEYTAAVETAERAMAMDPLDFGLKSESTFKYLQVGQTDKALALAHAILDQAPTSFEGLAALGNIYWRTGDLAEAYKTYTKLLEHHPNTNYIIRRISGLFRWVGDIERAELWIAKEITVNPALAAVSQAGLCVELRRIACATEQYEALNAGLDLDNPQQLEWHLHNTARLAALRGDWQEALDGYQKTIAVVERRGDEFQIGRLSIAAAEAADHLGREQLRDQYLDSIIRQNDLRVFNGAASQYIYWIPAEAYALRGDAQRTAELIRKATELGLRDLTSLQNDSVYDKVRNHPAMREAIEQLRTAANAERVKLDEILATETAAR